MTRHAAGPNSPGMTEYVRLTATGHGQDLGEPRERLALACESRVGNEQSPKNGLTNSRLVGVASTRSGCASTRDRRRCHADKPTGAGLANQCLREVATRAENDEWRCIVVRHEVYVLPLNDAFMRAPRLCRDDKTRVAAWLIPGTEKRARCMLHDVSGSAFVCCVAESFRDPNHSPVGIDRSSPQP